MIESEEIENLKDENRILADELREDIRVMRFACVAYHTVEMWRQTAQRRITELETLIREKRVND